MQEQTGIPYLLIDGRFENTAEALRIMGDALGVSERGEMLARDVEATFARLDTLLAEVPQDDRPRVYLARGPEGLETGMKGSINTEIIERAGGRNVADDGGATRGLVNASMEQLIVANPDTIVTWDPNSLRRCSMIRSGRASTRCRGAASTCRRRRRSAGSTGRRRLTG